MKRWGLVSKRIITDKLRSYGAAEREIAPAEFVEVVVGSDFLEGVGRVIGGKRAGGRDDFGLRRAD